MYFCARCVSSFGYRLFCIMFVLQYYSECHGVIYVVDSSDPENLAISAQTFSKCYLNQGFSMMEA